MPSLRMKTARSGYTNEVQLLTFGHGTASQEELAALIRCAGITRVVDVRTVPKSRVHPHVWSDRMAVWVPEQANAEYVWQRDLGGFRTPAPTSHHTALRNANFRGYADYMETERFRDAFKALIEMLPKMRVAIMCSETLWWRCHRRLIADAATLLENVDVVHLMPGGKRQKHILTEGVRREGDTLYYDGRAA